MAENKSVLDTQSYRRAILSTYDSRGGVNLIKSGLGFIHTVTLSQLDAAPTAGDITIYDVNASSIYGGGTVLFKHSQTTAVFMPITIELDIPFTEGLAVGFTAPIKDVNVVISYK